MVVLPDFYDNFVCKASSCNHSCCQGWEIDIDAVSADRFINMPGKLGNELRESISKTSDGYSFILTDDEKCPFLQDDKLCRLILAKGEEAIPDICHNHPRFFKDYREWEFWGIGLSCEAGCELLLSREPKYILDDEVSYSFAELVNSMGVEYLGYDMEKKVNGGYYDRLLSIMQQTEPIDDSWSHHLKMLLQNKQEILSLMSKSARPKELRWVYDYLAYRQMDVSQSMYVFLYSQLMTDFVFIESVVTGNLSESLRRLSEQIEYSTENVDIIIDLVKKNDGEAVQ